MFEFPSFKKGEKNSCILMVHKIQTFPLTQTSVPGFSSTPKYASMWTTIHPVLSFKSCTSTDLEIIVIVISAWLTMLVTTCDSIFGFQWYRWHIKLRRVLCEKFGSLSNAELKRRAVTLVCKWIYCILT